MCVCVCECLYVCMFVCLLVCAKEISLGIKDDYYFPVLGDWITFTNYLTTPVDVSSVLCKNTHINLGFQNDCQLNV